MIIRSPWKGKCKERVPDAELRFTLPELASSQCGDICLKNDSPDYENNHGHLLGFVEGIGLGHFVVRGLGGLSLPALAGRVLSTNKWPGLPTLICMGQSTTDTLCSGQ